MFNFTQREKIRSALESRAQSPGLKAGERRKFQRVARESRLFDRMVDKKTAEFKKANPTAPDGTILKMLLDWISGGGLQVVMQFIQSIIAIFVPK